MIHSPNHERLWANHKSSWSDHESSWSDQESSYSDHESSWEFFGLVMRAHSLTFLIKPRVAAFLSSLLLPTSSQKRNGVSTEHVEGGWGWCLCDGLGTSIHVLCLHWADWCFFLALSTFWESTAVMQALYHTTLLDIILPALHTAILCLWGGCNLHFLNYFRFIARCIVHACARCSYPMSSAHIIRPKWQQWSGWHSSCLCRF